MPKFVRFDWTTIRSLEILNILAEIERAGRYDLKLKQ